MKRSDFLKRIGIGVMAVAVAPKVLLSKPKKKYVKPTIEKIETDSRFQHQLHYYASRDELIEVNAILPCQSFNDLDSGDIIRLPREKGDVFAEVIGFSLNMDCVILAQTFPLTNCPFPFISKTIK